MPVYVHNITSSPLTLRHLLQVELAPLSIEIILFLFSSRLVLQLLKRSRRQNCLERQPCRTIVVQETPNKCTTIVQLFLYQLPIRISLSHPRLEVLRIKHNASYQKLFCPCSIPNSEK